LLPLSWASAPLSIPRVLLGTGGGGGGYDAAAWLAAGGAGFDSATTYCYTTSNPFCSHVAIANALALAPGSSPFIISKIEPEDFAADVGWLTGFGRVVSRGILQDLSVSSVDIVMFHQAGRHETDSNVRPECFNASAAADGRGAYADCRVATFRALQAAVKAGAARAIAVSNWQVRDLLQVFDALGVFPSALEVEVHPYWHEDDLIDFCIAHNITVINYAPLAVSPAHGLLADPAVVAVAAAHGVTPAQAALRWGLQRTRGVVIPRSANATHMAENMDVFGIELTDAEMAALAGLPQKKIFSVYCQPWC
jgi:diketogulonate reductase-like aldo/keto reductase